MRTVGVKLTADVSGYVSGMQRAKTATTGFKGELDQAAKKGNLDQVANQAAGVGLALVGMAGYAIKSAADFDKSMSAVSAATHASTGDMGLLRAAALQAGKDTMYSATQAADGITELSKAGISTADVLGGGLKGALSLAAAGQLSVGEAAETAASAMTQFKLKGDQVPHVADLLAAAAGKAQGSVHDMGYALNQSGLVASQFGLSIEDTTGVLGEFANAGLIGSDAGTSLKTMLISIANPSKITAALMQQLGIDFYDAQGKFVGLAGVADVLRTKLGGLSDQERQQALAQIFGNDALRAASVLYADGSKGVETWKNKVNDAGYASDTAARQTNNLAGDMERLKGSIETLAIQSGSGGNSGLRVLAQTLNGLVNQFAGLPPVVGTTITILAALGGAALLSLAGWVKLRKGIAEAQVQMIAMGPAGEKAATAIGTMSAAVGKASLVFAALEVVQVVADHFTTASVNVDKLTDSLTNFTNTGKVAGALGDTFGQDLSGLADNAKTADAATHGFWGGLNDLTTAIPGVHSAVDSLNESIFGLSFNKAKDNMAGLNTALTNYMGTTNDARKASDLWNRVLTESGLDTEQLAALLPDAWKKLTELNAAADKGKTALNGQAGATKASAAGLKQQAAAATVATDANGKYKSAADAAKAAALQEGDAMKQLADFMRKQADPVFALLKAQKDLKKASDEATAAIKRHGVNSVQARAATEKLTDAAIDLQGAVGEVGSDFDGKLSPALRNTLRAAHLTDAQIAVLSKEFVDAKKKADAYNGNYNANTKAPGAVQSKKELNDAHTAAELYDGEYKAKSSAPGAVQSKKQLSEATAQAKAYDGNYNAHATVTGVPGVKSQLASLLIQQDALKKGIPISAAAAAYRKNAFSEGGWTGPGSKYQEAGTVHADEFVIQADSRRKIEAKAPGMLDEMNTTGQVPGYASGGRVWPFPTSASMTRIPSKAEALAAVGGVGSGVFGHWPASAAVDHGHDSGVWRKIIALVAPTGLDRHSYGTLYQNRRTDNGNWSWHSDGRAVDFGGFNQDKLARFFLARQSQVLELIHRTNSRDYGVTRGRTHAMPHEWPLHRNHLHVAMKAGGTINEPIMGVGQSGRTYSFGENYQPERVVPNWQPSGSDNGRGGGVTTVNVTVNAPVGSHPREIGRQVVDTIGAYLQSGGELRVQGQKVF